MDVLRPSKVVTSAPSGGGIKELLIMMILMFTMLPITAPAITAKLFLRIGFIFLVLSEFD